MVSNSKAETRKLEGKVCLITGASRGIGQAIADCFAREGACVLAVSRHGADETAGGLFDSLPARWYSADIGEEQAVRELALQVRREFGKLDVLVNNAGVEYNERIGMMNRAHTEEMFRTNVYGVMEMIQFGSRLMRGGGSIINIASVVGMRGNPGQLAYSATKGAVIALTKSAAKELAALGIRVNAVAPGLTRTDMLRQAEVSKLEDRIAHIAMGRLAEPMEIADACLFFASDASAYISGQILAVDGCSIL